MAESQRMGSHGNQMTTREPHVLSLAEITIGSHVRSTRCVLRAVGFILSILISDGQVSIVPEHESYTRSWKRRNRSQQSTRDLWHNKAILPNQRMNRTACKVVAFFRKPEAAAGYAQTVSFLVIG